MKYKLLGKSGLRVSELALGAMTFGEEWGWGASKEESRKIFEAFSEAGGNFIDTANFYTGGTSEKYCGEFIKAEREKYVLATKYTLNMNPSDPNAGGNHRKNMMQSVEASLKRLGTDYIDLYWLHVWDYMSPEEEILRGLDDLVRAGKIFYIGISDTPAWIVARLNTIAELRGWSQFVGLQIKYSLLERTVERELLPMARAMDIAVTPWGVVGGGVLTGKYKKVAGQIETVDAKRDQNFVNVTDSDLKIAEGVMAIAASRGVSPAQVAINWARQKPGRIIPILGARTEKQIRDNLACLNWKLDAEEMNKLDELTKVSPGFPHDLIKNEAAVKRLLGDSFDKIENHRNYLE